MSRQNISKQAQLKTEQFIFILKEQLALQHRLVAQHAVKEKYMQSE